MRAENEAPEEVPVAHVLRVLGEYSAKVVAGLDRRSRLQALSIAFGLAGLLGGIFPFVDGLKGMLSWLTIPSGMLLILGAGGLLRLIAERPTLQLSVWQLQKVYEFASRLEDIGTGLTVEQRLELELRISEAQFLLNRAKHGHGERSMLPEVRQVLRQTKHQALASDKRGSSPSGPSPSAVEPG